MSVQNLDSVKVKWVIQGVEIKAAPNAWPINSLPWMTYEFELNKPGNEEEDFPEEYVINDEENLDEKSVELVRDVVTRNVTVGRIASNEPQRPTFRTDPDEKFFEDIRPMDVTWTDLGKTTSYLFPGVGIDYIYPLFLSREDRIYWYEQCRFRKNYVCRAYSPDDYKIQDEVPVYNAQDFWTIPSLPSPYTIIETKLTQSWPTKNRDIFISTKFEDLHKDINELRKNNKIETRKYLDLLNRLTNLEILEGKKWETISELLDKLSKVNNLLVAGGFALAFFRDRQKTNQWKDIDIFAYGDKAINNIEHAVTICLKFVREKIPGNYDENNVHYDAEANASMYDVPVRTKYAITIPIYDSDDPWNPSFTVQFILIKSRNIHEILSRFDLDCCAIGFRPSNIGENTEFYLLNRTVRALKTMTNVIDPTRQSPTYAQRLKKYVARGFEVAVPGLIEKELCVNAQSLTSIARGDLDSLSGLSKLIIVLIFNLTQNRRQRGDYDHITSSFALPLLAKFYFDKIHNNDNTLIEVDFVVGDILNSTNKVRTIGYWSNRMMRTISYKPSNFKIELLENGTQFDMIGSIHQTTTPFYAGYFDSNCLSFTPRRRSPEVDL